MSTQWRAAAGAGVIGLDYNALPVVMRLMQIHRTEWQGIFGDVRIMENAAKKEMSAR